jgi:hypothetical protein
VQPSNFTPSLTNTQKTNPLAIFGLVAKRHGRCEFASWLVLCLHWICVADGWTDRDDPFNRRAVQISRKSATQKAKGFAVAGLALSVLAILVTVAYFNFC